MNKGLDLGYTYIKTDDGTIFPSKTKKQDDIITSEAGYQVRVGLTTHVVGVGNYLTDIDKVDLEETKIYALTALALSTTGDIGKYNVVTGLPAVQYKSQRDRLEKMLKSIPSTEVVINNVAKIITIANVEIFPQSVGGFYALGKLPDGDYINIDWGGFTVDLSWFEVVNGERNLIKFTTVNQGTMKLYTNLIDVINGDYGLDYGPEKAEEYVKTKKINVVGKDIDITGLINQFKNESLQMVKDKINLSGFPSKTATINVFGGGGALYFDELFKLYKGTPKLIPNGQFINARGFKEVGDAIWENQYK